MTIFSRSDRIDTNPGRSRLLLWSSAGAFLVVLLGSNSPTPLLPLYKGLLGISPVGVAVAFSAYFVGLVALLALVARTRLTQFSQVLLPVAVLLGMSADVMFLALDTDPGLLYLGRLVTGASVALATGPAAALMLVGGGERGRAMIASVSILGGCIGLILSVCLVEFAPAPERTIYFVHLALSGVVLSTVLVAVKLRSEALGQALRFRRTLGVGLPRRRRMSTVVSYVGGSAGWIVGAVAVGALPVALIEVVRVDSLSIAALSGVVCLAAAALSQTVVNTLGLTVPLPVSQLVLAAGSAVVAVGLAGSVLWLVLLGCLMGGAGQAPAFATGLRMLSGGLDASAQGRVASAYSCVCYSAAGIFALASGAAVSVWGTSVGMRCVLCVHVVLCISVAFVAAADKRCAERIRAGQNAGGGHVNPLNDLGTTATRM